MACEERGEERMKGREGGKDGGEEEREGGTIAGFYINQRFVFTHPPHISIQT